MLMEYEPGICSPVLWAVSFEPTDSGSTCMTRSAVIFMPFGHDCRL